jgi:6-bladed beta-propeller
MRSSILKHAIQPVSMLVGIVLLSSFLFSQKLLKMPKPTHTDEGVPCTSLKVVKEIKSDFDKDIFFAVPWAITVGKDYFYVYDTKLQKIFVFNHQYEFVKQFLDQGQGPGEVIPGYPLNKGFYAARDGNLYVSDPMNDRIIQFSGTGKYIGDIKMNRRRLSSVGFPPILDKEGCFYTFSNNDGIIDKLDAKMNHIHTYLDNNLHRRFVIYKPSYEEFFKHSPFPHLWLRTDEVNTYYDFTSDDHLLIYLFRSSKVFIFKGTQLVRSFDVLIDRVLPIFRKRAERAYENQRKSKGGQNVKIAIMFRSCFVDKSEPYFYLQFREENKTYSLYKFNLTGKLVEIIQNFPVKANMKAKRNGLFYGFAYSDRHPVIFKKEELK